MVAATAPRDTREIMGSTFARDMAAGAKIYAGTIVALAGGFAASGSTALNLVVDGRARETVDNTTGVAGQRRIAVEKGTFQFANSAAADQIGRTEIGKAAYLVDNQTVAKTDGGGTRSIAGTIMGVDAGGVWVRFN